MLKYYIYYFNILYIKLFIDRVIIYFIKSKIINIFKALLLITLKVIYIATISIDQDSGLFIPRGLSLSLSLLFSNNSKYINKRLSKFIKIL